MFQKKVTNKIAELLEKIVLSLSKIFGTDLVGAYLYGSFLQGCFNSEQSDIDLIVIVKKPLSKRQENQLFKLFDGIRKESDYGNRLEVTFFTLDQVKQCNCPSPYLFCFGEGESHVPRDKEDLDSDLPLTIQHIYEYGIALSGPEPEKLLLPPKWETLKASIRSEIEYAMAIAHRNPVYAVLSLCRSIYSLKTRVVSVSKLHAARWGLQNFPLEFRPVITTAMEAYQGKLTDRKRLYLLRTINQFLSYCKKEIAEIA